MQPTSPGTATQLQSAPLCTITGSAAFAPETLKLLSSATAISVCVITF